MKVFGRKQNIQKMTVCTSTVLGLNAGSYKQIVQVPRIPTSRHQRDNQNETHAKMDDDEEAVAEEDNENSLSASNSNERWTCEACGCHTNQLMDTNCTICGTSNSGKFYPVLQILIRGDSTWIFFIDVKN